MLTDTIAIVVGVLVGFALADGGLFGLMGGLVGGWLGYQFNTLVRLSASLFQFGDRVARMEETEAQKAFFVATFVALGKVAKHDGQVCDAEIQWASSVMNRMGLSRQKKQEAIEWFDVGKSRDDITDYLTALREHCGRRPMLMQIFMEILVQCAQADGRIDQKEWALLTHIAHCVRFRVSFLEKIVRSAQAYQDIRGDESAEVCRQNELAWAYEILAIDASVSDIELKRAYRRLINQHHPDKLIAKGMPPEMLQVAKQKTQAISAAYKIIRSSR